MKNRFFVLTVCVAVSLTSCDKKDVIVDNNMYQESNTITASTTIEKKITLIEETIRSTTNNISMGQNEKDSNLEYVEEVRAKYANILSNKKYLFNVLDKGRKNNNHYEIPIYIDKQNKTSNWIYENVDEKMEIWFYSNSDGTINKSFHTVFTKKTDNNVIKEFIKVTLMALDSKIDESIADEYVRLMVESTGSSTRSSIVDAGEYRIFFEKNMSGSLSSTGDLTVYAYHKSEINKKVNKEEYKKYSVEEMKASLNEGEKAYLTVTLYNYASTNGWFIAKSDEGDDYVIAYKFKDFLMDFELNKKYTFYGFIGSVEDDKPCLRAMYYEE